MISGKNHTVPPNVLLAHPVPIQIMWCGSAAGAVTRREKSSVEQIRVKVEQIRAVRGLHEHVRHFMLQVTASASKRGNTAGRMTTNLNFAVKSY